MLHQGSESANRKRRSPEEAKLDKGPIDDMRAEQHGFQDWSSKIPIKVLKEKLGLEESSYLSTGKSKFTFIRKTRSDVVRSENVIDINLMPPLILKNCLPFAVKFHFVDSSNIQQEIKLDKDEERNMFCFSMAKTILADIDLPNFHTVHQFRLFDLQNYKQMSNKILLLDRYGRQTYIYTKIQRKSAGQRVIFYCKKLLIDSIDSELSFYHKKPKILGNKEKEQVQNMLPFVNQGVLKQKIYIIPEEFGYQNLYVTLATDYSRKECAKLEVETTDTQQEFLIRNNDYTHRYCY